jgi:hypothetical protein
MSSEMHAIHLELLPQMLEDYAEEQTKSGRKTGDKYISVYTAEFRTELMRAGYEVPTAASPITDSRFRIFLKIPGLSQYNGVYYVGGYQDQGTVSLDWDLDQEHIVPRRREAILATKAKG